MNTYVDIERYSAGEMQRKLWSFQMLPEGIRLVSYHEQTRKSKRHKFVGPKWDSHDERSYWSGLKRPVSIPSSVHWEAVEKWKSMFGQPKTYIGWWNADSELK